MSGQGRTDQLLSPIRITVHQMPEPDCFFPISYALQRGILLRRKNPGIGHDYWAPVAAAMTRGFEASKHLCRGKCALPSALLVVSYIRYRLITAYN